MTDRIPDSELDSMLHRHEAMCQDRDREHRRDEAEQIADYVPRLVAEVRRLRAVCQDAAAANICTIKHDDLKRAAEIWIESD